MNPVKLLFALVLVLMGYLLLWPVEVDPKVWVPSTNPGFTGPYDSNEALAEATYLDLPDGEFGPEDITVGPAGQLVAGVNSGKILTIDPDSGEATLLADTGGHPLGLEFDSTGILWVADPYKGLLKVSPLGEVTIVTNETSDGSPILYADDVDIASDGRVYFSDASTRFGAEQYGGTLEASLLDLMEHSDNARVLVYDPQTTRTEIFADGLTFANGVAVTADGKGLLVSETGNYAIHRYSLAADSYGERTTIIDALPGFPDNINRMPDGSFWVGLVSPRSDSLDALAGSPFLRRVVSRLPARLRPAPQRYGFIIRINEAGDILANLQDPSGSYATTTGAMDLPDGRVAVSSLTESRIALF